MSFTCQFLKIKIFFINKNLDMDYPEKGTEDLLISITKYFQTLIHQTHTKPQEALEKFHIS